MALLALSKCRFCLKLGDFYSIFAEDNSVQLAQMAMACSNIQIEEGDGLPDKVCGECVEKLSSAYIFKQQCERSDAELRKNLNSSENKDPLKIRNESPSKTLPKRNAKLKRKYVEADDSNDGGLLEERYSVYVPDTLSLETTHSNTGLHIKKRRLSESSNSFNSGAASSKEKTICKYCNKLFNGMKSLCGHLRVHKDEMLLDETYNGDGNIPQNDDIDNSHLRGGEKFKCDKCGELYHNRILFNEHKEHCECPIDEKNLIQCIKRITCPLCKTKYKNKKYLRKHLGRTFCGVKLKGILNNTKSKILLQHTESILPNEINHPQIKNIQCSNCEEKFGTHGVMLRHFFKCIQNNGIVRISCMTCDINFASKNSFYKHIRRLHIVKKNMRKGELNKGNSNSLECHKCGKQFPNQSELVSHLAAHMINVNENSKANKPLFSVLKCAKCNKKFRYKATLRNHFNKYHNGSHHTALKIDDILSQNQCDLCGKTFKYAKSLKWHKSFKHPKIDDSLILNKRAIEYSQCSAKCLHCHIVLENEIEIKNHNKIHAANNVKVKNEYTCPDCGVKFTNTKIFRFHIREHNNNISTNNGDDEDGDDNIYDASISNFCEITSYDNHDSYIDVDIKPSVEDLKQYQQPLKLNGITCTVCNKRLESLKGYHLHMRKHVKTNKNDSHPPYMRCFVCQMRFTNKEDYQKHMRIHYKDKNIDPSCLVCYICKKQMKSLRSYIAHMSWHTIAGRFKCYICEENFSYFKTYRAHMDLQHKISLVISDENTDFQCHICVKYFEDQKSLDYHILCHQKGEGFQTKEYGCAQCNEEFTSKYQYMVHMQSCHRINIWNNDDKSITNPKYGKNLKKVKVKNIAKIPCPVCDEIFLTSERLDKHLKKMHPVSKMIKKNDPDAVAPEDYLCILCGKNFPTDERLQTHISQHNKKRVFYKCTLCSRKSPTLKNHLYHLKIHLYNYHNKEETMNCEQCDEQFTCRRDLRVHLKESHDIIENYVLKVVKEEDWKPEELKEHQCNVCGKILSNQATYYKHMENHNSRRCNYCLSYFEKKSYLLAHIRFNCDKKKLIGNSDPFDKKLKCHICYKQFSIYVKLLCHLKVQHDADPINKDNFVKSSVCDFCLSVFPSEERMLSHRKVHFYSTKMKCRLCLKPFRSLSYFKNHKVRHYKQSYANEPLKCEHCHEQFVSLITYITHLKVAHTQQMVWLISDPVNAEKCSVCNKEFENMDRHMMYHDKYKCKKCNQYFLSENLYKNHFCEIESENENETSESSPNKTIEITENFLTGEHQQYDECSYCFKPITSYYTKSKHDYNHKRVVYFCCRLCDRRFFMKSAFNIHSTAHRLQHFKKNPLRCRHCGESFTRYQHYTDHIRQVHDDPETMEFHLKPSPPRDCLICKKPFINIYRHYKYHMSFRCKNCSKYILSQTLYNKHKCNDETEDPNFVVKCDEDITSLIDPDVIEWENERLVESIPRDDNFASNESDYNDSYLQDMENVDSVDNDHHMEDHTASMSSSNYLTSIKSFNNEAFDNFSPVISSTVSLSTSITSKEKDDMDIVNIQVKTEPIDTYYREYGQYDLQNSLMDIDNPSG